MFVCVRVSLRFAHVRFAEYSFSDCLIRLVPVSQNIATVKQCDVTVPPN